MCTLSKHILKTYSDEDSYYTFRQFIFQWMIVLTIKNVFILLKWNISWLLSLIDLCLLHVAPCDKCRWFLGTEKLFVGAF